MPRRTTKNRYIERNTFVKDRMFNRPVARLCAKCKKSNSLFVVMEASGAKTSRALRRIGIKNEIHTFTNNRDDYENIPVHELKIKKKYGHAHDIYPNIPYHKSVIVIHDGSATADNTFPDMQKLVARRFPHLVIIVNVSTRCASTSHNYFVKAMKALAFDESYRKFRGYEAWKYSQGPKNGDMRGGAKMRVFYFEMSM